MPATSVHSALTVLILLGGAPSSQVHAHAGPPVPLNVFAGPRADLDLTIATNYGLLSSALATSSSWGCELGAFTTAERYFVQFTPAPHVIAIGRQLVAKSVDEGCSWLTLDVEGMPVVEALSDSVTAGMVIITGLRPSPSHPEHSAVWLTRDPAQQRATIVYRSNSLELLSLATVPSLSTLYAGGSHSQTHAPALVRSLDSGQTWQELAPQSPISIGVLKPLYVDPTHVRRLLVRASGADVDQMLRSYDGGETLEPIADVRGRVRQVVQLAANRVAVLTQTDSQQRLYLGPIEGPFEAIEVTRRFRDLAVQQGRLIGLEELETSELRLAISPDEGRSWSAHSAVGRQGQLAQCHRATPECVTNCTAMSMHGLITPEGCGESVQDASVAPSVASDAGVALALVPDASLDAGGAPSRGDDGGCALRSPSAQHPVRRSLWAWWALSALLALRWRRRRAADAVAA